jgi:hypothetical protein
MLRHGILGAIALDQTHRHGVPPCERITLIQSVLA